MFLNGFLSNSSPSNGFPVFGLIGGRMGFFTPPAPIVEIFKTVKREHNKVK